MDELEENIRDAYQMMTADEETTPRPDSHTQKGKSGKAKGYQVEQFLARYELEREEAKSGKT